MPKGYWIVQVDVTDTENYPKYLDAAGAALAPFNPVYLVVGGDCTGPEGPVRSRNIVIEFSSYADAKACYASPAYQEAARLRQTYASAEIVIVEGA